MLSGGLKSSTEVVYQLLEETIQTVANVGLTQMLDGTENIGLIALYKWENTSLPVAITCKVLQEYGATIRNAAITISDPFPTGADFACKGFYLCPSCSQKRTLLFSEHLSEDVLLDLPHRQFVFTFPKALRIFFRNNRTLFADVSRLIFSMIREFYKDVAGTTIKTGMVIAHQTFGDMLRWNPYYHALVLVWTEKHR